MIVSSWCGMDSEETRWISGSRWRQRRMPSGSGGVRRGRSRPGVDPRLSMRLPFMICYAYSCTPLCSCESDHAWTVNVVVVVRASIVLYRAERGTLKG